jgi:predicted Zn-dependent protease
MKTNRQNACIVALALSLVPVVHAQQAAPAPDAVVRAMRDEIARSMKKLRLENLEMPYFISYVVFDTETASASASFGSITSRVEPQRSRFARVQVRVGDYKFDNGNFFSYSFARGGMSRNIGGYTSLPLDDNYDEMRRQLWLATDASYKKALEDIARKRASLANKNRGEVIPDFSKEDPVTIADVLPAAEVNPAGMESLVRDLSALFRQAPEIHTSSVNLRIDNEFARYVNSEGASTTFRYPEIQLSITMSSQASDGQPLAAGFSYRARSLRDLPPRREIEEKIRLRTKQIAGLRAAPLPDRYAGPVLFEGEAAAEIVYRSFMPHLLATPEILVDNPQLRSAVAPDRENLVEKIGLRVLPDFLSLTDDPTATALAGAPLLATYKVDDEGVRTRPVKLVEDGLLVKLLTGRAPVLGIPRSSGSYHSGGVMPSNMIVTSTRPLPLEKLRADLIRRAKLRGKDYGIIVRKIDFSTRGSETSGTGSGSLPVLLAYKYFPDGREEPVRNAIINGIGFSSFKDILAVSDTATVWSASYSPRRTDPLSPSGSNFVSLAIPSLLFEDATVQKPTGSVNTPPFLEHPYFTKK